MNKTKQLIHTRGRYHALEYFRHGSPLGLHTPAFSDVMGENYFSLTTIKHQQVRSDFNLYDGAVFLEVPPYAGPGNSLRTAGNCGAKRGGVFSRTNVFDCHREEVFARIAVVIH